MLFPSDVLRQFRVLDSCGFNFHRFTGDYEDARRETFENQFHIANNTVSEVVQILRCYKLGKILTNCVGLRLLIKVVEERGIKLSFYNLNLKKIIQIGEIAFTCKHSNKN